jgi:hypothetical protein
MGQLAVIALGWIATAATSWCLGKLLLRWIGLKLLRQEENALGFILGSASLSLLVFGLAVIHLVNRWAFGAVIALVAALAIWRRLWRPAGPSFKPLPRLWSIVFWAIYLPFAGLYIFHAAGPEASPDGASYHLGLVARYLKDGGFVRITTDYHASLPQGVEMLFVFACAFGRYSSAALVHCSFLLAIPFVVLAWARRKGIPAVGVAGGLMVFTAPVAAVTGTSAYNDVALACVLFAAFAFLQIWDEEKLERLLVPAGILAGFTFDIKYTAFLMTPYAIGFVAVELWAQRKPILRPVALVALCASATVVPTILKNWWMLSNPVPPFLNRVFPNPYVHVAFEEAMSKDMRTYGTIKNFTEIPIEATVKGGKTIGLLGPLFLLAPLSLLALRTRTGRHVLLLALLFALPYPANIGTRFLLPCAVFLAPAMALAVAWIPGAVLILVLAHAISTWPTSVDRYCTSYAWRLLPLTAKEVLRKEPEEGYLKRWASGYDRITLINQKVPKGARVFSFSAMPDAYSKPEILVGFYSAPNERLLDAIYTGMLAADLGPRRGLEFAFQSRLLRKIRLVQTSAGKEDIPAINQVRVLAGGKELPFNALWKVTAHPFPWDARLAFDGNPVTRWRAWQSEFPGMYMEADFGRSEIIDHVSVATSASDQWNVTWELRGQKEGGEWQLLAPMLQPTALPAPPEDLRTLAMAELKATGISYLIVADENFGSGDFKEHLTSWNLEIAGSIPNATLYLLK